MRGFVSISLMLSFIIMSLTGIVLYITPHGRVAYWINWKLAALSKDDWRAVHTIIGMVFMLMGAVHLAYNWKVFVSYLKNKIQKGLRLKKELVVSTLFIGLITVCTIAEIPPFKAILDVGDSIKASWGVGVVRAPIPHAELMTIGGLIENLGLSYENVMSNLDKYGIKIENTDEIINSISERYDMSPLELYRIIEPVRGGGQGIGIGAGKRILGGRGERQRQYR
jgi:hypothetical protein